ncbi:hypothetical protein DL766_004778 [Monosporascus sp. MC13-8B]|uniref:Uncharacterized protein n=1 Tax=Monosporascus cannonballus TaxID=155416 RepID=A0ABY0H1I2_9PEZI|nr:hypothetical protein DL762_006608 [Monosporascus cannonballus]RYO93461.1 hypothetical protein DL763_004364 [Monosporascus cannonballus]RYP30596.1 hypothetical protein DL766_004778 [Monosporascus sp. MC13-8B]
MYGVRVLVAMMAAACAMADVIVDWRNCNNAIIRKTYGSSVSLDVPSCQRAIRIPPPGNDFCILYSSAGSDYDWILENSSDYKDLTGTPKFNGISCGSR